MSPSEIRNWLGLYVLCLTSFLGGYSFLAPDLILPMETSDRLAAFEIILPLLVAQVSAVYRFFSDPKASERTLGKSLPSWVVKGPPVIVTTLLFFELLMFAVAGLRRQPPPSPETFKGLVTFCVSLLNASTILVITRYFDSKPEKSRRNNNENL